MHFIGLNNVLNFKVGTMASLGDEQIAWLKGDLARVSHSTPVVVLGHIPMWTIWEPWGWGTADSAQAMALLRPFGSVTVLNGHIHQVLQKVEGNVALHTAMSLAYPLPAPGQAGIGEPGPVTVPAGELGKLLGTRQVSVVRGRHELALIDTPLDRLRSTRTFANEQRRYVIRTCALALRARPAVGARAGPLRSLRDPLRLRRRPPHPPPTVDVDIAKFAYGPKEITVAPGTKIVWTNHDETPHTVTSSDKSFASKGWIPTTSTSNVRERRRLRLHLHCASVHDRRRARAQAMIAAACGTLK